MRQKFRRTFADIVPGWPLPKNQIYNEYFIWIAEEELPCLCLSFCESAQQISRGAAATEGKGKGKENMSGFCRKHVFRSITAMIDSNLIICVPS